MNALPKKFAALPREVAPHEAVDWQKHGALLLDVREEAERAAGIAEGAVGIALGDIAARIREVEPTARARC